ncbi:MAG: hypothetical protein Kow0068_06310 [Marinilabiliales bacterium]
MKNSLFLLVALLFAINAFGQWVEQATGFTAASRGLKYICAVDQNIVWATAYDGINTSNYITEFTRTTDGGNTWTPGTVSGYTSGYGSSMIYAIDGNTAWMPVFNLTSGGGAILKTTNGGVTWTAQTTASFSAPAGFPNVVHFWDANNGWCMGDPNGGEFELYTTTDGGTTWTQVAGANIPDPIATDEYGVTGFYSVVNDTVWFTTNKGRIYKSTDRGYTWSVYTTPLNDQFKVVFKDGSHGLAYQITNGTLIETSDGGQTWSVISPNGNFYDSDLAYVPGTPNTYISSGNSNGISYSLYGGHYWTDFSSFPGQMLNMAWVSPTCGWVGNFNTDATTGGVYKWTGTIPTPPNDDLGVVLVENPTDGVTLTSTENIQVDIMNYGVNPQSNFPVSYRLNGGAEVTETVTATINPGQVYTYTFTSTEDISTVGIYNVISYTGLTTDEDNSNDTLNQNITIVDYVPQKIVLGEEATGCWCGWCVRGHVYMEQMALDYPDTWIGIAVHNNDPMVVTAYDSGIAPYIGGYPSGLVDRDGEYDPSEFPTAYLNMIDKVSPVDLSIENAHWDNSTRLVTFDVQAKFVTTMNTDYNINAVIVENGVTGTDNSYDQANYYSYQAYDLPLVSPTGFDYQAATNPVPYTSMVYDHVAREILDGWAGSSGTIPASVSLNDTYYKTYNYTVPATYDENNIELIGMIIDNATGKIVNATKLDLYDVIVGIDKPENDSYSVYPNPANNLVYMKSNGDAFVKIINIDGKIVWTGNVNRTTLSLDVSDFAKGVYIVQFTSENETYNQKLIVR